MTRDDVIRMGREACLHGSSSLYDSPADPGPRFILTVDVLEIFAQMVAAVEREACAKICETLDPVCYDTAGYMDCAAAIRARK